MLSPQHTVAAALGVRDAPGTASGAPVDTTRFRTLINLVERSPGLRAEQQRTLGRLTRGVQWHEDPGAALAVAALMSFLFSGTISRPLIQLKQAADKVAQGDLDCRVEIDTRDEIGELATSFNRMVADMKQSTEQLQEAGDAPAGVVALDGHQHAFELARVNHQGQR